MQTLELLLGKHAFTCLPEGQNAIVVAKNDHIVFEPQHAIDCVVSDVASVKKLESNAVKHEEIALIVCQDEVVFSEEGHCDLLVVNLMQLH